MAGSIGQPAIVAEARPKERGLGEGGGDTGVTAPGDLEAGPTSGGGPEEDPWPNAP